MNTLVPKTAKAAAGINAEYYFTGKPCKRGHLSKRRTSDRTCLECAKERGSDWINNNRDKKNASTKKWREKNPELRADYGRKWRSENPDKNRAKAARRRAARVLRTPSWLSEFDKARIRSKYEEAERLTRETGIAHHVDHVIPLNGEFVSGLHVPDNLQVLTEFANLSKGNRFDNLMRSN